MRKSLFLTLGTLCSLSSCSNAQALKTTRLPDGTGTIGLPPGWKVLSAYRGSVACAGPQGAVVNLGIPWTITLPIDPVSGMRPIAAGQAPTANVGDTTTALQQVLMYNGKGHILKLSRRTAKPVFPGVPAYNECYDFTSQGKTYTGVGYITSISYGQGSPVWSLYASAVVAPKAIFWKVFPTMMKIWGSWRVNGKTPDAGSSSALIDSIIKARLDSAEKNHLYFRENILGN